MDLSKNDKQRETAWEAAISAASQVVAVEAADVEAPWLILSNWEYIGDLMPYGVRRPWEVFQENLEEPPLSQRAEHVLLEIRRRGVKAVFRGVNLQEQDLCLSTSLAELAGYARFYTESAPHSEDPRVMWDSFSVEKKRKFLSACGFNANSEGKHFFKMLLESAKSPPQVPTRAEKRPAKGNSNVQSQKRRVVKITPLVMKAVCF